MDENPYSGLWKGLTGPKMEGSSVDTFANDIFFYKIPTNPCVIKLGNLIKMEKKSDAADIFILEFGNNDKGTDGNSFASDIEFDSITLTLNQESIDARIRKQPLSSVLQESGDLVLGEDETTLSEEEKQKIETEKQKLLQIDGLTQDQKEAINGAKTGQALYDIIKTTADMPANALNDVTTWASSIGKSLGISTEVENKKGGGKRSMMSSFSRQFELPMPCHAKKRRSRSKKSRGGRRKKGKHTRKHHK